MQFHVALLAVLATALAGCASDVLLPAGGTRTRVARANGCPLERELRARPHEHVRLANPAGAGIGAVVFAGPDDYGTLMVSGGNAMGRYDTASYTRFAQSHGFRVVAFSFQGYDDNGGEPSLDSLLSDAATVHDEIARRHPGEPIAYLASSISTAPAICMASHAPDLAGVVLEGQIDLQTLSFQKMGQWWPLLPLFPITLPYSTAFSLQMPDDLRASRCASEAGLVPALFLHHPRDSMTSWGSARHLYQRYAGPKQLRVFRHSRDRVHHLLLSRDRPMQEVVVGTVREWLRRP